MGEAAAHIDALVMSVRRCRQACSMSLASCTRSWIQRAHVSAPRVTRFRLQMVSASSRRARRGGAARRRARRDRRARSRRSARPRRSDPP